MPFVCGRIVIDFHWRRKGHTVIRAAREHHVCAVAVAWRTNTAHHVNIVVRRSTRAIHCQKDLPCQPSRIYIPAGPHPTQIDLSDLFEDWRLSTNLRVSGANAPKLGSDQVLSTNEQFATSGVPCMTPWGILIGLCQLMPPSVERLNSPDEQGKDCVQNWY
jgi:hypothetical protein